MDFPPLLREFLVQEGRTDLKLKVVHKSGRDSISRLAKDNEKANILVGIDLGTPRSANLYEDLEPK